MKNIKIIFSYNGSKFCGSQKQPNKQSVEDKILKALESFGIFTKLIFSGRTDTGVHATNQCANFFLDDFWADDLKKFKKIVNQKLMPDIFIKHCEIVNNDFHARYSAKKRTYRYIIKTSNFDVFGSDYWYFKENIDIAKIQNAIKYLVGTHDFEYFCKSGSDTKTFIRTVHEAKIYQYKSFAVIQLEANGFLRSQIRMIVGALLNLSDGKISIEDWLDQISKIKKASTKLAPACGLYLCRIKY